MKSFECPKSIRNYKKKIMLGTSDAWWMSHSSQQTSEPGYYIVDCRICIYADKVGGPKRVQKCADVIMDGLLAI